MRDRGLNREEKVFMNRVLSEYKKDELPHHEQIRHDVNRLFGIALRLDQDVEKMSKREA